MVLVEAPPSPEDDWRPVPSVAEVLAHNARVSGGFTSAPWLRIDDIANPYSDIRVVMLSVGLAFGGERDEVCGADDKPSARYRPLSLRGGSMPWPASNAPAGVTTAGLDKPPTRGQTGSP